MQIILFYILFFAILYIDAYIARISLFFINSGMGNAFISTVISPISTETSTHK